MVSETQQGGGHLDALPQHITETLKASYGTLHLEVVAAALRNHTDAAFPQYQDLLADAFAQWTAASSGPAASLEDDVVSIAAIAKLVPLAPYLTASTCNFLQASRISTFLTNYGIGVETLEDTTLCELLLAIFRLLSFDLRKFRDFVPPLFLSSLFGHDHLPTRYLAILCMCQVIGFADATEQTLLARYINEQKILGHWEGDQIDFRLLRLYEERRWLNLSSEARLTSETVHTQHVSKFNDEDLHITVASFEGVLLPRFKVDEQSSTHFVKTSNARRNLHTFGRALQGSTSVLILGPPGSGKSLLVTEAAHLLGHRDSMITLHLNDQTDAKSLLGFYTSSTDGKGFVWQPGVLTKAVQEGHWVLIEDINRIPAEVASILQPLTENNELFLPSRKERLRPHENFRLLGTVTTIEDTFKAGSITKSLLNTHRHWYKIILAQSTEDEVTEILKNRYSSLEGLIPQIWEAHSAILTCYKSDVRFRDLQNRLPTLRDLRKWCSRLSRKTEQLDGVLLKNNFPEDFWMQSLKDGFDIYASHLPSTSLSSIVVSALGQHLNIAPAVAVHVLEQSVVVLREDKSSVQIGRTRLEKMARGHKSKAGSAQFANTRQARAIMETISASIVSNEPLLLVGETGIGKTTIVQHIADSLGQALTVVNLSQQSEATDLLGGLKPITTRSLLVPLMDRFNGLFEDTFNVAKNESFRSSVSKAFAKQRWSRLLTCWEQAVHMAKSTFERASPARTADDQQSSKRRKLDTPRLVQLRSRWDAFASDLENVKVQIQRSENNQLFAFVESRLVQAVRNGEWVLLDEINLASAEALDNILSLLQADHTDGGRPFLLLAEAGRVEKIYADPNFRLFAAMNPATDTGKKDLPPAVRSQFTELYTHSGDNDLSDLSLIVETYLGNHLNNDKTAATDLAKAYLALKSESQLGRFVDGAGDVPHYSLRSLTRCLQYAKRYADSYGLRRSMYEGLQMSFFTVLDHSSRSAAQHIVEQHLFAGVRNIPAMLSKPPKRPSNTEDFVVFGQHYVLRGPATQEDQSSYIKTASVERNLAHLARAASMRRFPILLQGPTSAGKTSMVEYLARYTGNRFVRINNHEHTDLQEYLGTYMSGSNGQLVYAEGVLVEALRKGYWIVLDELNLAPSDVLEALNRLLDDNRELLIPESQEIVRPHPNFMLFATQNPAGLYGGRKRLSRAFRNRFLEIHVDDIPENELEIILGQRAQIPQSFCKQIVQVYKSLSLQRQSARLFEQHNSFATLRDLFRWASRPIFDRQELAKHGFMLLGERVRNVHERSIVKSTIEATLKVRIDERSLYGMDSLPPNVQADTNLIWTPAMRRLFVLVSSAISNNEPVLLVGETGIGKTQICQTIAEVMSRNLDIYNAHSNTESSDLIGSQRPIRHKSEIARFLHENIEALSTDLKGDTLEELITKFKTMDTSGFETTAVEKVRSGIAAYQSLFAWNNGSLVRAMLSGNHFLLDEISLADDSVLERLNSVLEPARTILLAEKGAKDNVVVANPNFQFLATMNPGGDYGKRELSAALRNRLTEIWVPPLSEDNDILPILQKRLGAHFAKFATAMLGFAKFFHYELQDSSSATVSLRSLLAWVNFIRANSSLGIERALFHGCALVYIDSLGANPAGMISQGPVNVDRARALCVQKLSQISGADVTALSAEPLNLNLTSDCITIGDFSLSRTTAKSELRDFTLEIPTTLKNAMRLLRAMHTDRPVLLEGNPGVGKTALVSSLANMCGRPLARINLSDQTDLMDLFGSDTPAEGQAVGTFVWQDGPLLQAMQQGQWILLDEMNLASQSVLEGLNACLDHRKEVYISELDKTFTCDPSFKLFATQNPHHQGGGRKGLPASFVNRFTVVYADPLEAADLVQICHAQNPNVEVSQLQALVAVISQCQKLTNSSAKFADGGPWELNLRDTNRWLDLVRHYDTLVPATHFDTVIAQRFRSDDARAQAKKVAESELGSVDSGNLYIGLSTSHLQIGSSFLARNQVLCNSSSYTSVPTQHLQYAKAISIAISQEWPVILSGPPGSGKTTLIRTLAQLSGVKLIEFAVSADTDIADFIGGYEQHDVVRELRKLTDRARELISRPLVKLLSDPSQPSVSKLLHALHTIDSSDEPNAAILRSALALAASALPEAATLLKSLDSVVEAAGADSSARFVWNDGILIDALEEGSWLVLDNANLCNPSVLDRLNSLLEPNGALIINEQHSANEGCRKVKPHTDFRIFLVTDTANGELSRAMRNRSLEIYLNDRAETLENPNLPAYPASSSLTRLRPLFHSKKAYNQSSWTELEPWISQLSATDLTLLANVVQQQPEIIGKAQAQMNSALSNQTLLSHTEATTNIQDYLPIKLLLNEPLVTLNSSSLKEGIVEYQTRIQFLSTTLWTCYNQLEFIRNARADTAMGDSVLQKSYNAYMYGGRASNNWMPQIYTFSDAFISVLIRFLNGQNAGEVPQNDFSASVELLSQAVLLICDMGSLFQKVELDEPKLQAYTMLAMKIFRGLKTSTPGEIITPLLQVFEKFYTPLQLTSGKHMQHMWHFWRPSTAKNEEQFFLQKRLEGVFAQFDKLCRSSHRKLPELAALRLEMSNLDNSFLASRELQDDVSFLDRAMGDLEQESDNIPFRSEVFESTFSAIRALFALHQGKSNPLDQQLLQLLARPKPRFTRALSSLQHAPQLLERIEIVSEELLNGNGDLKQDLFQIFGPIEVVTQIRSVLDQSIGSVGFIAEQSVILRKFLSSQAYNLTASILPAVQVMAKELFSLLTTSITELNATQATLPSGQADIEHTLPKDLEDIYKYKLHLAWDHLTRNNNASQGKSLLLMAEVAIELFVPDKVYDPAVYPALLRERHQQRTFEFHERINAYRNYQIRTTGQNTSAVIRLLEADLAKLGEVPQDVAVYRPPKSQLQAVQAEFSNILRTIVKPDIITKILDSDVPTVARHAALLASRVQAAIKRLQVTSRAYSDIVRPVIGFLNAMLLGTELVMITGMANQDSAPCIWSFLLTGSEQQDADAFQKAEDKKGDITRLTELTLQASAPISSEGVDSLIVNQFVRIVDRLFLTWKQHLSTGQAQAAANSKYYSYREVEDDAVDEAELNTLFPQFDNESNDDNLEEHSYDSRSASIQMSELHRALFEHPEHQHMLSSFLKATIKPAYYKHSVTQPSMADGMTPILLLLEDTVNCLKDSSSKKINVYNDSDIDEVRKLLGHVRQCRVRFQHISSSWPEHATPVQVLEYCQQTLRMSLKDPIAKLLTRVEKLLDLVSQWQSVASREYSALDIVESLTSLIIRWRRLELSSWSRLLDEEAIKHRENTDSWYFIAYEAIIHNSMAIIHQDGDVPQYCLELARTLEEFFINASIGSFTPRLELLRMFEATIQSLEPCELRLQPIRDCVRNVIDHYSRYAEHINKSLVTERAALEKDVSEQIKLASWKDTNVTALRESARRTHYRLFKIVKKYRGLLDKPLTNFKAATAFSHTSPLTIPATVISLPSETHMDSYVKAWAEKISDWQNRPARLRDLKGAAKSIQRLLTTLPNAFAPNTEVAAYLSELSGSVSELRKATPGILNEDNGALVRDLKNRKRRVLADTMKDLSVMGVRRNLGSTELLTQSSSASVLSSSWITPASQKSVVINAANDAFHELLDAMPQARASLTEHSDELTDGEVRRGVGLLEGLLSHILQERKSLHISYDLATSLRETCLTLSNMQSRPLSEFTIGSPIEKAESKRFFERISWLSELLKLYAHVTNNQAKYGDLPIDNMITMMYDYASQLENNYREVQGLTPTLEGILPRKQSELIMQSKAILVNLRHSLESWARDEPNIEHITRQILPWTDISSVSSTTANGVHLTSLGMLDAAITNLLNSIFVAVQDVSVLQQQQPSSSEDRGWLISFVNVYNKTLHAFKISQITVMINSILSDLIHVEQQDLNVALSMLLAASPVIRQYYTMYNSTQNKLELVYLETCRFALYLATTFATLAKEGFCTPAESADREEQSGKLESGTGLGEGEAAEDISKDVGDDEDLSELAQEAGERGETEQMDKSQDAVDMGMDDLEGEMGSGDEAVDDNENSGNESADEEEKQIDEETGSVDDLDPTAVDEKMWDDMQKDSQEQDKEMKSENAQGKKSEDNGACEESQEQVEPEGDPEESQDRDEDVDDEDGQERPDGENIDPHLDQKDALELPDDIQVDGKDAESDTISDMDMDDLSDVGDDNNKPEEIDTEDMKQDSQQDANDTNEPEEEDNKGAEPVTQNNELEDDSEVEMDDEESKLGMQNDEDSHDVEEQQEGETGVANNLQADAEQMQMDENAPSGVSDAQQATSESKPQDAQESSTEDAKGDAKGQDKQGTGQDDRQHEQPTDAFQRLADVIKQYHRRREILTASEDRQKMDIDTDLDMAEAEFEHADQEDQENETQALGASEKHQAQDLSQGQAVEDQNPDAMNDLPMPNQAEPDHSAQESLAEKYARINAAREAKEQEQRSSGLSGGSLNQPHIMDKVEEALDNAEEVDNDEHDKTERRLPANPTPTLNSKDEAHNLWSLASSRTQALALMLTEQLRLILQPTTATKLRGDYRTGKRLNIRRIIPYIASGYKKDKIWMRRSVPSKRNYQVMLAVDDSKSMAESGADVLAMETLCLVSRALSGLEVGELSILAFGQQYSDTTSEAKAVKVAHPFATPFVPSHSGLEVFRHFSFQQRATNIQSLLHESIALFKDARLKSSAREAADLWQLQLIISDGHIGSDHDVVRRLVRKAREEKIMCVFVVVDAGQESILDLKEVYFETVKNGRGGEEVVPRTKRYLEGFPFQYYVVVKEVGDLPGVLCTVLRGWFESVVETGSC